MAKETLWDIALTDLALAGLRPEEATAFYSDLHRVLGPQRRPPADAAEVWRSVVDSGLLKPSHSHPLHQLVYYSVFARWDFAARGPPPYWFPDP